LFHPPGAAVRPDIQTGECPSVSQLHSVFVTVSVSKDSERNFAILEEELHDE
jgi:hypothetical protein